MKQSGHTSRAKCGYALADRNQSVTKKGLFRKEGVALRNPVPHTRFRTITIVQPCAKRFHTLCHVPNIFCASFAHDFNGLSWFVIAVGSGNNFQDFLLPPHIQVLHSVGHVRQNPNEMLNRPSHCIQNICPTQMVKHRSLGAIHVFVKNRTATSCSESAIVHCQFETNLLRFPTSSWFSEYRPKLDSTCQVLQHFLVEHLEHTERETTWELPVN